MMLALLLNACSPIQQIRKTANKTLFSDATLGDSHIGIAVLDPVENKYLYNYQAEKFFVPASNMKILSLYAGLKYLGDSLPGMLYYEGPDTTYIQPTGDPTLLHRDFATHPVIDFLKNQVKPLAINVSNWRSRHFGNGWMWDDYQDAYMPEKSALPVYGNVVRWIQIRDSGSIHALAREEAFIYSEPDISWGVRFSEDTGAAHFSAVRALTENSFLITQGKEANISIDVPFMTLGVQSALSLLKDVLEKDITVTTTALQAPRIIYSQPSDSIYKSMMYRSDNFYAEQILLMASQKKFGVMDEQKLIQGLLQNELNKLPQTPNWVDGSGLSRYNLVSPQDFVWLLQKMKNEFGMERMQNLFPTGGKGTLRNYYKGDHQRVYAKTGTLSGVVCLSGFIYSKSGKPLIFSVLVNNHMQPGWKIRRKTETLLTQIADRY